MLRARCTSSASSAGARPRAPARVPPPRARPPAPRCARARRGCGLFCRVGHPEPPCRRMCPRRSSPPARGCRGSTDGPPSVPRVACARHGGDMADLLLPRATPGPAVVGNPDWLDELPGPPTADERAGRGTSGRSSAAASSSARFVGLPAGRIVVGTRSTEECTLATTNSWPESAPRRSLLPEVRLHRMSPPRCCGGCRRSRTGPLGLSRRCRSVGTRASVALSCGTAPNSSVSTCSTAYPLRHQLEPSPMSREPARAPSRSNWRRRASSCRDRADRSRHPRRSVVSLSSPARHAASGQPARSSTPWASGASRRRKRGA